MRSTLLTWLCLGLASAAAASADSGQFAVFDATTRQRIDTAGEVRVTSSSADLAGATAITGAVENLRAGDRGVILEYRIPLKGSDARFCGDPERSDAVGEGEIEENVYPIAAMTAGGRGVAAAIPPTSPCEFGMVGTRDGLTVRFYLGLSPETRRFPNRAPFSLLVYPVDAAWAFRDALSQYYRRFPGYYSNRSGRDGQFLFLAEDGKEPSPGDLSRYGYTCVETQAPWFQDYLNRDRVGGILSLPYSIVGMREVKFLKTLPKSYEEAMADYAHWTLADNAGHEITKENEAGGRDEHLREQVESSYCETAAGRREITLRHTPWGLNSVTFVTNPNPDLFADEHRHNVGRDAIDLIKQWRAEHPEVDGVTIDSLGGNWPANLNYRREQFRYVRYPLTCDSHGRVAIHNEISHYEFLSELRSELRADGQERRSYINANGIYSYPVRPDLAQHYRTSTKETRFWVGRFFLASQLDFAVSEPGIISPDESLEFMRAAMGRKVYSPTNARFEDPVKVARWVNRCLCYGLFGVNVRRYGEGSALIHYYPKGYRRDQALWDWFVPKVRLLSRAGWEPVTRARADAPGVKIERYGSGSRVYFAVLSENEQPVSCHVSLDLAALGFDARTFARGWTVDEMARGLPVRADAPDRLGLTLRPYETCILCLRKS